MSLALVLILFIALLIALAQFIQKRRRNMRSLPRKILHVGAIGVCACAVYLIPDRALHLWIVGAAIPLLALAVHKRAFLDPDTGRKSWGILYFVLVYFVLLVVFADSRPELVFFPMLVLALADGLATIIGERWGVHSYRLSSDGRTLEGSVAFFLAALAVLLFAHVWLPDRIDQPFDTIWMAVFVCAFLSLVEAISARGQDNLWVPLALVYWMQLAPGVEPDLVLALGMLIVPVMAAVYAHRAGWLQAGGAVAALLLAWVMLVSPAPSWFFLALAFFITGTLLTRLPGRGNKRSFGNRSHIQVFANGAFPVLALMLYFVSGSEAFLFGFAAGFACAMSDTASSEIGTRLRHATFYILDGHPVQPGLSGGVSWSGLAVGAVFSLFIAVVFTVLLGRLEPWSILLVAAAGFAGNILDSVFGASVQVKYRSATAAEWADSKPAEGDFQTMGYERVTNDVVNLMSTACATVLGIAGYCLL